MTMLTNEQQSLVRTITRRGMPTDGTGLRGVVGINLDGHTRVQECLVGDHAVQFSKGPLGIGGIGTSLLLARLLAPLAPGSLSNVSQVLQAKECMRIRTHNLFTHDMVGVLLQPSLPSTDDNQSPGCGTGAFSLKTLSQACVMIGFGNNGFTRMKRLLSSGGSGHSQVADTDIYPNDAGMPFGCRVCSFHFQGDQQVELLLGLVIPQFGSPDVGRLL